MSELGEVKDKTETSEKTTKSTFSKGNFNPSYTLIFLVAVIISIAISIFSLLNAINHPNFSSYDEVSEEEVLNNDDDEALVDDNSTLNTEIGIEYNNKIVEVQVELIEQFQELGRSLNSGNIEEINNNYQSSITKASESISQIENLDPIEEGEELKNAAINLFSFYSRILDTEYKQIVDTINAEQDPGDLINSLSENIAREEARYDVEFRRAQEELAEKYGFELN